MSIPGTIKSGALNITVTAPTKLWLLAEMNAVTGQAESVLVQEDDADLLVLETALFHLSEELKAERWRRGVKEVAL